MKRVEVEVLGEAVNATVIRVPGRRFPGIIIQGDSLNVLANTARRALEALGAGKGEDASNELQEMADLLNGYRAEYEQALDGAGLELPYVKTRKRESD